MNASLSSEYELHHSDAPVQSWPCCCLAEFAASQQEQQRLSAIATLGLTTHRSIPAFEEALQQAARFLNAPLGWVSVANATTEYLKATYGLSNLGLGNPLAQDRQFPLSDGLSTYVLDSEQPLVVSDTAQLSSLAQLPLVVAHGITAYCAVPLVTSQRQCIGVLTVMDTVPRTFSQRDVSFLAMAARWGMAEYERTLNLTPGGNPWLATLAMERSPADTVRLHLMGQLVQDLRNPLTVVLGMASMLSREIYGPLTDKQREYTDIMRQSSQTLMSQVDEIVDLGLIGSDPSDLVPTPVDMSSLGQQVMTTLAPLADKLSHTLDLSIEPQENPWILDRRAVKQILYHTVFSLMQLANENSTIRVHASRRGEGLALALWVTNPWLGEGLPSKAVRVLQALGTRPRNSGLEEDGADDSLPKDAAGELLTLDMPPHHWLGLLLSLQLAQHHGGQMQLNGNAEVGHRLIVSLPTLNKATALSQIS
jgi:signal transduction histidine kinase